MGIVDDGGNHDAEVIEAESLFDKALLAGEVTAVNFETEGLAKNAQGVAVSVESAGHGGGDEAFGIMILEGLFDDRFAGSGLAQKQAKATLLAVDPKGIKDVLLMRQQ
jgi:hypothetical protein